MNVAIVDHSLNLSGDVTDQDAGFGIDVLPDGTIVQREPREHQRETDDGERRNRS